MMFEMRSGEVALANDPARQAGDDHVVFIGTIRSPWTSRADCPKNMREARERGGGARIDIDEPYRQGLHGLAAASHIAVLSWLHHAPRNLIVQKPRHAIESKGTFALRSPARPNPIGLHIVGLISVDIEAGVLTLDIIDALDGTPVIDIKPYFASTDSIPDATYASSRETGKP
jgi:tRNA-Thr(GGU) m(6)t(6)A37 methyltransferase TsaA